MINKSRCENTNERDWSSRISTRDRFCCIVGSYLRADPRRRSGEGRRQLFSKRINVGCGRDDRIVSADISGAR
jgi:hypothetical protein